MATSPLDVTIWSGDMNTRLGWVNDAEKITVTTRHLAVGAATVTVTSNHPMIPILGQPGNRLMIKYLGNVIMSGPIRANSGKSGPSGEATYSIESDERRLWSLLGWPSPGSQITAQGIANDVRTGPAETVLKGYMQANTGRLSLPVQYAPDLGRGAQISASIRMTLLSDSLLALLTTAGIGLSVVQVEPTAPGANDGHLLVDVYTTNTYPYTLTEASGIVQSASWSTQAPSVTRTVVGGAGTGTSRQYVQVIDAAAEALWHDVIEAYTDDTSETDPTKLTAAGQATLTGGAATASLSLTLSATDQFMYGTAVNRGDVVSVELNNGVSITNEVLTEATLNWDRQTGFTATPTAGDRSNDPTKAFVKQLVKLGRTVRKFLASA